MATYANIDPTPQTMAVKYAVSKALTTTEATIYNQSTGDPVLPRGHAHSINAVGTITITGGPSTTEAYVVMQTDLGNGIWIDVAWFPTAATSGTKTFYLSCIQSVSVCVEQTRASGTAPGFAGASSVGLLDRIRFVGKAVFTGGTNPAATVSLSYKLLGLR